MARNLSGQRLRIRRMGVIPPDQRRETMRRFWAWSRPHVAEEIERLGTDLRYGQVAHKEIHFHALDVDCPNRECLVVDTVDADVEIGPDELREV